jgi:hypothetical protein
MTINFRRQIQRSADWISAPWYARDHICLALKLPELFTAPDASISSSPVRQARERLPPFFRAKGTN